MTAPLELERKVLRIRVQHDGHETGPFSIAELFEAIEEGTVCAMDWCWVEGAIDGLSTVHDVLTSETRAGRHESRSAAVRTFLRQEASAERVRQALLADPELRAEIEDYRKRLAQELLGEREKLASERFLFEQMQAEFYEERSRLEADLSRAREDLETLRTGLVGAKKRLSAQIKQHELALADFEERRKRSSEEQAEEQARVAAEWDQLTAMERRLNDERTGIDLLRKKAGEEENSSRSKLAEEFKRVREMARRVTEDKEKVEEHRRRATAHIAELRERLEAERAEVSALEQRVHASRSDFEAGCRRTNEELDAERRRLDEERRRLASMHRDFASSAARMGVQSSADHPRDERYHGRVLGLSGKVSFEEIKKAYRFHALRCHPDKVQDLHPDFVLLANQKLREINEAFEYFRIRYERRRKLDD